MSKLVRCLRANRSSWSHEARERVSGWPSKNSFQSCRCFAHVSNPAPFSMLPASWGRKRCTKNLNNHTVSCAFVLTSGLLLAPNI
eukprot:4059121-Pyramimonas_sp.AAC.1